MIDMLIVIPVLVVGVSLLVFFREGSLLTESPNPVMHAAGTFVAACADFFVYQKAGIVLAQFFCSVPFAVRVIKSTFDQLDPRTEHVALTLGCTRFAAFRRVSLPCAKSGIIAGGVLAWARAFGLFGPISVVAGAVRQRTEVLSTSIFLEITVGKLEAALAISLVMAAVAFVVLLLMRLFSGGNLFGTGVKA
jgi:molybdate transport system permease protein